MPQDNDFGLWMHLLLKRLYPICRSLSGPGNRETLDILSEYIPLKVEKVPSGSDIYGWKVPNEWHPRSAEITGPNGEIFARFSDHNLHLVNGSHSIDQEMDLDQLLPYIYSLPDQPDLIPYVTSYYHPHWGFCMKDEVKRNLLPGRYKVRIDADHIKGNLIYGEVVLPGESTKEILISTYICHPSMANDNLSGVVVGTALYQKLARMEKRHYTYRLIFIPETIGALCWLSRNEDKAYNDIHAGLVLSCLGEASSFTYKCSRRGNTEIDRIASNLIQKIGETLDFFPTGSDERQYCSPGFNLPVGLLARTYPGEWPFYHTSGDTPDQITPETLNGSLDFVVNILKGIEGNSIMYRRVDPRGEPMLSKYDLYHRQHTHENVARNSDWEDRTVMMWLLNLADGEHSLIDIAERSGANINQLTEQAVMLCDVGLLEQLSN